MKQLLVIFLWLLALLLLAGLSWGIALWNAWPLWAALFLFIGALSLYFFGKFAAKLARGWLARSRTATPVEKPEPVVTAETALKHKWREAISLLRKSNLRKVGNPLYVLPWYMVIGRSGSGKSTALTRARLTSPLTRSNPSGQVVQTENIDWWYFDKAVVLDTAGRYIAPSEIEADRKEWDRLLDYLGRYRAREGLNGLVLTIQADLLLSPNADALAEEGRVIRMRIEQLIRLFDKRFPIYVLVTKSDLLYGMEAWSRLLPEGVLDQAMGYVGNEAMEGKLDEAAFINTAFDQVGTRLKRLQLAIMQRLENADPALLLFPSELARLQSPLTRFLRHALGDSPYLEAPFLRGIFFASGLQQGGAVSTVLSELAPHEPAHTPTQQGMFLHDLFDRVLPTDRYLLRPAAIINHWRRATRHLGVSAWFLLVLAVGGYFSFSFVHSLDALNTMRDMYPQDLKLNGQLKHDLDSLEKFRSFAYWLEQRDERYASRMLVFDQQVGDVESRIKADYVAKFRKYILPGLDDAFSRKLTALLKQDDSDQLADYIQTHVRRINMVQARLDGASHEELRAMPPLSGTVLFEMDPTISPEAAKHFNDMYVALLAWQPNDLFRQQRLAMLKAELNQYALSSNSLDWIVNWANAQSEPSKVRLSDFWKGSITPTGLPEIPAAFTLDGKARIDAFMQEVRKSAPNQGAFDDKLALFNAWYANEKIRRWRDFAWNFTQGEATLSGEDAWRAAVSRLATKDSPYLLLANRLVSEFNDYPVETLPSWLALNKKLFDIRLRAGQQSLTSVPGTLNDIGGKLLKDIAQSGDTSAARSALNRQLEGMQHYQAFDTALRAAIADSVISVAKATQQAAQFHGFDSDPTTKSLLQDAYASLTALRTTVGGVQPEDQVSWSLLTGPLQLAIRYVDRQASCTLQQEWESKVMWPTQSATDMAELMSALYGDNGTLWAFLSGTAKPFVKRGAESYLAQETLGQSIPFSRDFLPFVNAAVSHQVGQKVADRQNKLAQQQTALEQQQRKQDLEASQQANESKLAELKSAYDKLANASYLVTLSGLPSGVNKGAQANVIGTLLSVQCANGQQQLNNLNFAVSESFSWSQQSCGETRLQIKLPSLTLHRRYAGAQGFADFLREFETGTHSFAASDFSAEQTRLETLGINQITLRYRLQGQDDVLNATQDMRQLDQSIRKLQATQKELRQTLSSLDQQQFQSKMQGLATANTPVSLEMPSKIGQCWNSSPTSTQAAKGVHQIIDDLVAKKMGATTSVKTGKSALNSNTLQ